MGADACDGAGESDVTATWLAQRVRAGAIGWVLAEEMGIQAGRGLPGDTRAGSKAAMAAVTKACRKVTLPRSAATARGSSVAGGLGPGTASGNTGGTAGTNESALYDCRGRAQALTGAGG